ncbi:MAG: epoxide hydrolase [Sphingomonas sp.]|uniref:epoxide hydrolase family protein n=1 Tax=Sphingomonas sp. TaxID=28214 RepID=UPI001B05EC83|nr:epoxide hydrolase family protein [Sphingomonas sp.]MBO9621540.1 epoxide hydrolase [Sphingomonas sp.]
MTDASNSGLARAATSRREMLAAGGALMTGMLASGAVSVSAQVATTSIRPFRVAIPQGDLDDLRRRLAATRWPEPSTQAGWAEGPPLERLSRLVDYWRDGYDWRAFEARINAFPQFLAEIDGLDFHFLHVRSPHPDALPIVLTHGWPGSVAEFLKVIGPLADPVAHGGRAADAFHVVVPSLPGYGFSGKPTAPGWDAKRVAKAWITLMDSLGYRRWVAQGGDWGAIVTTLMAQERPQGLDAIHLNLPVAVPAVLAPNSPDAREREAVAALQRFTTDGWGYRIQATRPQTIGYSLADSPVGLAGWIYEKFQSWTDNDGDPETALTRDEMLDDISLYWLTNTAASAARFYRENAEYGMNLGVVDLPVGVSIFPGEIFRTPRSWAEKVYPKLVHWNELDRGGHFAALEQPALFVEELRACFRDVRSRAPGNATGERPGT